ncbi:MAG: hypothetical protein V3R85_06310 [Alphaproteobacteria bacterium]
MSKIVLWRPRRRTLPEIPRQGNRVEKIKSLINNNIFPEMSLDVALAAAYQDDIPKHAADPRLAAITRPAPWPTGSAQ